VDLDLKGSLSNHHKDKVNKPLLQDKIIHKHLAKCKDQCNLQ
jgi:hypothetical protein